MTEQKSIDTDQLYSQTYSHLSNVKSELDDQQQQLSNFLDFLDEIQSKYEELDDSEKRDVASAIGATLANLDQDTDLQELLEYREEINEAYTSPIARSVKNDVKRIFTATGARDSIESVDNTALQNAIQSAVESSEEEIADIQQDIHQSEKTIDNLSQPALDHISEHLSESPSYYAHPKALQKVIAETRSKHERLIDLNAEVQNLGWFPESMGELHLQENLYSIDNSALDEFEAKNESITQRIDYLGSETELPITDVLNNDLEEKSDKLLNDPLAVLRNIANTLESITNFVDVLKEIEQLNSSGEEISIVDSYATTVTDPPESLDDVAAEIEDLNDEYRDWKEDKHKEAVRKQSITKSYLNHFEIDDELVQDIVSVELSSETAGCELVDIIRKFEKLIEARGLKEIRELDERAEDIFHDLVTDGERTLSKEDISSLKQIIDIIDIKVTVDESGE